MVINVLDAVNKTKSFRWIQKVPTTPKIGDVLEVEKIINLSTKMWEHGKRNVTILGYGYDCNLTSMDAQYIKGMAYALVECNDTKTKAILYLSQCMKQPEYKWSH